MYKSKNVSRDRAPCSKSLVLGRVFSPTRSAKNMVGTIRGCVEWTDIYALDVVSQAIECESVE